MKHSLRAVLVASRFAIGLCALESAGSAATVVFTYIQNVDLGTADLAGDPAIIWTATFDPSTDPASPFTLSSWTDNADALADGVAPLDPPSFLWGPAGQVDGIHPANFVSSSYQYNLYNLYLSFPACQQPCNQTATDQISYDQFVYPYPFFTPATYDSFSAVTPEPGSLFLIGLGGLAWGLRRLCVRDSCIHTNYVITT